MEDKTAGRDMSSLSIGILSSALKDARLDGAHYSKHNRKSNTDGGADEDVADASGGKGGIFTMTIPMRKSVEPSETAALGGGAGGNDVVDAFSIQSQNDVSYAPKLGGGNHRSTTIRLTISKLSTLRNKVITNYQCVAGLPWRLAAKTECSKRTGNIKFFSVYIDCNPESESTLWSCDAVVEFRLISQRSSGAADFTRQFTNKFSFNSNNWGFPSFMEWSEVTNPDRGFVREDKVVVEALIIVQKVVGMRQNPTCDFTTSDVTSDGVLIIDGMRLHISKPYLALYSPVFRVMFYAKFAERNMKEIPLEDVVLEEFVELLNVIYPSHAAITADTVEFLLELGDKFEIPFVMEKCENFLIDADDNVIPCITKLAYADQYCLAKLHDICIQTIKNMNMVKELKQTDGWRNLSDATKAAILEKVLKLP